MTLLMSEVNPHWNENVKGMMLAEMEFATAWSRAGEIVYNLSPNIAAMFALTSTPTIDWDRVPHRAFVVKVPREYLPLKGTIEPEFSYLYVSKSEILVVSDYDTPPLVFISNLNQPGRTDYFERTSLKDTVKDRVNAQFDKDSMRSYVRQQLTEAGLLKGLSTVNVDALIEASVEANVAAFVEDGKRPEYRDPSTLGLNTLAVRFVANTIAYIENSPPSSVSSDTIPGRRPYHLNVNPPADVVVTRDFREGAKAAVSAVMAGSLTGIRRVLKHQVRGHWRNQASGPKRSQRVRRWIYPHTRGDQTLGSVVRRVETIRGTSS